MWFVAGGVLRFERSAPVELRSFPTGRPGEPSWHRRPAIMKTNGPSTVGDTDNIDPAFCWPDVVAGGGRMCPSVFMPAGRGLRSLLELCPSASPMLGFLGPWPGASRPSPCGNARPISRIVRSASAPGAGPGLPQTRRFFQPSGQDITSLESVQFEILPHRRTKSRVGAINPRGTAPLLA